MDEFLKHAFISPVAFFSQLLVAMDHSMVVFVVTITVLILLIMVADVVVLVVVAAVEVLVAVLVLKVLALYESGRNIQVFGMLIFLFSAY